jgi:TolB-like protein/Tfp pilus assembly protein PilF
MNSFFRELKQRKVYRVALGYAVAAWLVVQIAFTVLPSFHVPEWLLQALVVLVALGFPAALVLAWAFDVTPSGIEKTPEGAGTVAARNRRSVWLLAGVGLLIAALAIGSYWIWHPWRSAPAAGATIAAATSVAPSQTTKSIAILPFENLSEEKANAYFADGIQEEILTRLSRVADLKVISRTSTQRYKSAPSDLSQIAKQLGVTHVLEGGVQRAADQVRVNVQLINAVNDAHVWAETYDRKLTDAFVIESDIANAIAEKLQAKISGGERDAMNNRPTKNSEAHELYLKGRYFWNKRTADGLNTAIGYFNQAIEKDPDYAAAYAGLADVYSVLPNYSQTRGEEAYPKAETAAMKALELNDKVAEAHIALANVRVWHRWANGAEEEFKKGLQLDPNYSTGHQWYSIYLSVTGKFDDAISEMEKARELDPFSIIINTELGCPYLYLKRYDRAIEHFQKALEMEPSFPFAHFALAEAYDCVGRYKEAIAEHNQAVELGRRGQAVDLAGGDAPRAWYSLAGPLQNARKQLGGPRFWQDQLASTIKLYNEGRATASAVASVYAILGDNEQALGWLETAYQQTDDFLVFLSIQRQFDPLRSDPRFQALLKKIGLVK